MRSRKRGIELAFSDQGREVRGGLERRDLTCMGFGAAIALPLISFSYEIWDVDLRSR